MSGVKLRRSQLVTPASEPDMMAKAATTDADEVIFDLEDAVTPDQKAAARESVVECALNHDWEDTVLGYRINGIDTRWWYEDVIDVVSAAGAVLDELVVPKVSRPADVHAVETLLEQVEVNAELEPGHVGLTLLVEDASGMAAVHEIASASDRIESIVLGPGDYSAAIGAPGLDIGQFPEYPGHYWHYALSKLNVAAKAADIRCIDGPFADVGDLDGFRTSARYANMLGCDGKWVIHPSQIEVANEVFAPDPEVAERAQRIVTAYAEATESGSGAVSVDGQMVDEATNRMATKIVAEAEAAGIL